MRRKIKKKKRVVRAYALQYVFVSSQDVYCGRWIRANSYYTDLVVAVVRNDVKTTTNENEYYYLDNVIERSELIRKMPYLDKIKREYLLKRSNCVLLIVVLIVFLQFFSLIRSSLSTRELLYLPFVSSIRRHR